MELNASEFGQVVSLFPVQVLGTANVTISPLNGSELPPILNGMEVYTASDISKGGFKLQWSGFYLMLFNVVSILVLLV